MTATYAVTYRLNGAPVTVPGAPTSITGPSSQLLVQVAEIQILGDR